MFVAGCRAAATVAGRFDSARGLWTRSRQTVNGSHPDEVWESVELESTFFLDSAFMGRSFFLGADCRGNTQWKSVNPLTVHANDERPHSAPVRSGERPATSADWSASRPQI